MVQLDNRPRDWTTVVDEETQAAAMVDERGQRWQMREGDGGGREAMKAEARGGLPGGRC